MTEYIASSAEVGRRPRISLIRAYSPSLSPSSAHGCGWTGVSVALPTVSDTAATLPVFGQSGPGSPIVALSPVEEEPARHRGDFRRGSEPDADPAVVQQGAQDGHDKHRVARAAQRGEVGSDSRHNVLKDHNPQHDS